MGAWQRVRQYRQRHMGKLLDSGRSIAVGSCDFHQN
nr:MAG TPA: hypothetical protein [Caudoviricetes sp.]